MANPAAAQVFGTFNWQMRPYCNRVTLTLTSAVTGFTLAGTDDQCGAATKGSVVGMAVFNADGTVASTSRSWRHPADRGRRCRRS